MRKRVFEYNGVFFKNQNDSANRSSVIGVEMEFFFAPTTSKFKDHVQQLRSINVLKESKPSLVQVRKLMREIHLNKMAWFIHHAEEDGVLDELVFHPLSKDLVYDIEDELSQILTELLIMGYGVHDLQMRIGIHHNIEISDMNNTSFYKFCKSFVLLKDLIYKVSDRRHLSTDKADIDFHIGDRWGLFSPTDKKIKYDSFIDILMEGFKKKLETTLLGIRIYPDGRPLIEIMWYNSTLATKTFYEQIDFTYALKEFALSEYEPSKKNFIKFVVEHKLDYQYLYDFILNEVEEFSLTRLLRNDITVIQ